MYMHYYTSIIYIKSRFILFGDRVMMINVPCFKDLWGFSGNGLSIQHHNIIMLTNLNHSHLNKLIKEVKL